MLNVVNSPVYKSLILIMVPLTPVSVMSPVVPYKEMRAHTKKVVSKLPEYNHHVTRQKKSVTAHTNRIRQQLYSKVKKNIGSSKISFASIN